MELRADAKWVLTKQARDVKGGGKQEAKPNCCRRTGKNCRHNVITIVAPCSVCIGFARPLLRAAMLVRTSICVAQRSATLLKRSTFQKWLVFERRLLITLCKHFWHRRQSTRLGSNEKVALEDSRNILRKHCAGRFTTALLANNEPSIGFRNVAEVQNAYEISPVNTVKSFTHSLRKYTIHWTPLSRVRQTYSGRHGLFMLGRISSHERNRACSSPIWRK